MRRLHLLTDRHRTGASNRTLGLLLAFNAGAVNAGGFLVVHFYTSHMTGVVSLDRKTRLTWLRSGYGLTNLGST